MPKTYPITELMTESGLVALATWILVYGDDKLRNAVGVGDE